MSSQIGNQLKSQTLDQVLASTFTTVGGRVFPDLGADPGLNDFIDIVNSWRSTHASTYGAVIPNSGVSYAGAAIDLNTPTDLIAASDNEVLFVNALSIENIGVAAIEYQILVGTTVLEVGSLAASTKQPVSFNHPLYISKGQSLNFIVTSGAPAEFDVQASAVKTVQ
mgnify:CR=1 FL=1